MPDSAAVLAQVPALATIQPMLDDPTVTEVMVNGPDRIFVERQGTLLAAGAARGLVHDAAVARGAHAALERVEVGLQPRLLLVRPPLDRRETRRDARRPTNRMATVSRVGRGHERGLRGRCACWMTRRGSWSRPGLDDPTRRPSNVAPCGCSSVGRAQPCQGCCRRFESDHPLQNARASPGGRLPGSCFFSRCVSAGRRDDRMTFRGAVFSFARGAGLEGPEPARRRRDGWDRALRRGRDPRDRRPPACRRGSGRVGV